MGEFKSKLQKQLAFARAFNVLIVIIVVLTTIYGSRVTSSGNEDLRDMIHGFQVGIFVGIEIVMVLYIIKYRKALRNDDELKQLYIKMNDERSKLIQDKIGGVGFNFSLAVVATATVISGFFHQLVFVTLLGVLIFLALVKGFLKIYYRKKY